MSLIGIIASSRPPAPFTPASLANLKIWYDASDTSTISVSGNSVTQWNDKSTSAINISQATAARQPQSGTTTLNSKNVVAFDGGDVLVNTDKAAFKFMHDGTKNLIGIVAKIASSNDPASLEFLMTNNGSGDSGQIGVGYFYNDGQFGGSPDTFGFVVSNGAGSGNYVVDNRFANGFTTPSSPNVFTYIVDPNNATTLDKGFYFIGTGSAQKSNASTGTPSSSNASSDMSIGAGDTTGSFGINGYLAEIVIATGTDVTEDNRVKLRDYLINKWGL